MSKWCVALMTSILLCLTFSIAVANQIDDEWAEYAPQLANARQTAVWKQISARHFSGGFSGFTWDEWPSEEVLQDIESWLNDARISPNTVLRRRLYHMTRIVYLEFSERKISILSRGAGDGDNLIASSCMRAMLQSPEQFHEQTDRALLDYLSSPGRDQRDVSRTTSNIAAVLFPLGDGSRVWILENALNNTAELNVFQYSAAALLANGHTEDFSRLGDSATEVESILALFKGFQVAQIMTRDTPNAKFLAEAPVREFIYKCMDHPEVQVRRKAFASSISTMDLSSDSPTASERLIIEEMRGKYARELQTERGTPMGEYIETYLIPLVTEYLSRSPRAVQDSEAKAR